jgi:hypothetical protein
MPWNWPKSQGHHGGPCRSFPESIRYDISLDTTLAITAGIDEIIETLFIALALVISWCSSLSRTGGRP